MGDEILPLNLVSEFAHRPIQLHDLPHLRKSETAQNLD
jgi:hypothetical protein